MSSKDSLNIMTAMPISELAAGNAGMVRRRLHDLVVFRVLIVVDSGTSFDDTFCHYR